ncbi:hypothetical protein AB0J38_24430 [Streptomyces sp. NPDC050095]|uniref:hypothetical protein n=1 Tax=unclassified Streptomyces TaxID=2593676 RepID=UPI00343FAAA0
MPEVDELLDDVTLTLPDAATVRARGARRTTRRRILGAGGVAAAVLAGVLWGLPDPGQGQGQGEGREVGPAASASAAEDFPRTTPYKKDGTIQLGPAKDLPRYGSWHWVPKAQGATEDAWPPARVGFGPAACEVAPASTLDHQGGSWDYTGTGGAVARQVYLEYTTPYDRMSDLSDLIDALTECGLSAGEAAGAEPSQVFKGSDPARPGLTVWVEHGWKWIRVVQEQSGVPSGG